jgi:hypothetical protein
MGYKKFLLVLPLVAVLGGCGQRVEQETGGPVINDQADIKAPSTSGAGAAIKPGDNSNAKLDQDMAELDRELEALEKDAGNIDKDLNDVAIDVK